ncbi:MAG: beta-lactam-binding protein with PASTA domain [Saprospiraceae bacterium]|jgi:beta-lactam-binding protein with PASTA domain
MKERLSKLWGKTKTNSRVFLRESSFFLTSNYLLKNLAFFFGAVILLLLVTYLWLGFYTDHGESVQVGDYIGLDYKDAVKQAEERNIKLSITDSIYVFGKKGGTIQDQNPQPLSRVKENRTITLITYKHTEQAKLPRLKGNYDYERYKRAMAAKDFDLEVEKEIFDPKQAAGTILYLLNDGKEITEDDIEKGMELPRGIKLKAVVTKRSSDFIPVPDLVCKTYNEAEFLIESARLNVGEVIGDVPNLGSAYIYQQSPKSDKSLRIGEMVTIYVTADYPEGCN